MNLSFSIFLTLMLIQTALSHALPTHTEGCGKLGKCGQDAKQLDSYIESNKKLTQVNTRFVQHQQSDFRPSTYDVHSQKSYDETNNQELLQLLQKMYHNTATDVRPANRDIQHHSIDVQSNSQINRLLIQLLVKMYQQETTTVTTPCGQVTSRVNYVEVNQLLKELLEKLNLQYSVVQHHSTTNVSNQQLTYLLIQFLLQVFNQQPIPVNSPCNNVQFQQNFAEINRQLTQLSQLLAQLSQNQAAAAFPQSTFISSSSQIPVELSRREPPIIQPVGNNVLLRPAGPVNTNKKLVPVVTGLLKHELNDVEDLLGDVTSSLI